VIVIVAIVRDSVGYPNDDDNNHDNAKCKNPNYMGKLGIGFKNRFCGRKPSQSSSGAWIATPMG
jgi:hypothetical protein